MTTACQSKKQNTAENPAGSEATALERHGALHVEGAYLMDKNNEKFQLHGLSTHGLQWYSRYTCAETLNYIAKDWNANCIRLAMYTAERGYCEGGDKEKLKKIVSDGVENAKNAGIYAIIDWHILKDQNPMKYVDESVAFFDEMSSKFADYDNVIYEICNEPNTTATWSVITEYANRVIPVIRKNAPNAVIIVGTPSWSQDIDKAMAKPLEYSNVMYSLHFYAATHKQWLISRMERCIESGFPVFITEFGICDASGNGKLDYTSAEQWKEAIEKYNVSYMCWNLANHAESASLIKTYSLKLSNWEDKELNEQGIWIRDWLKSEED